MPVPIRRKRDGTYAIRLDSNVCGVLANLADQLGPLIDEEDPATLRLFPPAYVNEEWATHESEYRSLVGGVLANHHRQALDTLAATARKDVLTEGELHQWLAGINSLRLVLGTKLDVTEEMLPPDEDDPTAGAYACYELLGELQHLIVLTLASELPDEGRPETGL